MALTEAKRQVFTQELDQKTLDIVDTLRHDLGIPIPDAITHKQVALLGARTLSGEYSLTDVVASDTSLLGEYRPVARALNTARDSIDKDTLQRLENSFAEVYALWLLLNPDQGLPPEVRVNNSIRQLDFWQTESVPIPACLTSPLDLIIEYGPGLATMVKIPAEVKEATKTFMIERRRFVLSALKAYARLHGVNSQSIETSDEGIAAETSRLLTSEFAGNIDLIVATAIQIAGKRELKTGITNGYHLLKPGGIMAIRAFEQIERVQAIERADTLTASQMIEFLCQVFNASPIYVQTVYATLPNGVRFDVQDAVFQK